MATWSRWASRTGTAAVAMPAWRGRHGLISAVFLTLTVLLAACDSPAPPGPALAADPTTTHEIELHAGSPLRRLLIVREYGNARFSECRMTVTRQGGASLWCAFMNAAMPPATVHDPLDEATLAHVFRLAEEANLYAGAAWGGDSTAADGTFEMLRVTNDAGETAVIVTSANPTFATGTRQRLQATLGEIETRLRCANGSPRVGSPRCPGTSPTQTN